ncbi:hypothetical protein D3C75_540260 [compost metagenome]
MIMHLKCEADLPPQCPPSDAASGDVGPVYRYIEGENLDEVDFLNHKEKNLYYSRDMECEALALSFYTTIEAANDLAKRVKKFRKKKVISGRITSTCGIHKTTNDHLNLWIYRDIDMMEVFLGGEDKDER